MNDIDFKMKNKKYNLTKVLFDLNNLNNSDKFNFNKAFPFNDINVLNLEIVVI